jgi:hypothetical protein
MLLLDDQDRVLLVWRHRLVPDRWGWELLVGRSMKGSSLARRLSASWKTRPATVLAKWST